MQVRLCSLLLPLLAIVPACTTAVGDGDAEGAASTSDQALVSTQMTWSGATPTTLTLQFGANALSATQAGAGNLGVAYQVYVATEASVGLGPATGVYVELADPPATADTCQQSATSERVQGWDASVSAWITLGETDVGGAWVPSNGTQPAHCQTKAGVLIVNRKVTSLRVMGQGRGVLHFNGLALTAARNVKVSVFGNLPLPPQPSIRIASQTFRDYGTLDVVIANDGPVDANQMEVDISGSYLYCDAPASACGVHGLGQREELPYWLDSEAWPSDYAPNGPTPPRFCGVNAASSAPKTVPAHGTATFSFTTYFSAKCLACTTGLAQCAALSLDVKTHTTASKLPGQHWDSAPHQEVEYPFSLGFPKK